MKRVGIEMLNANEGERDWFPFDRWWRDGFIERDFDFHPRLASP